MTDIRKDNLPERPPSKRIDEILAQPYEFMKCRGLTYEARRDFLQLATEVKHLRRAHDIEGLIAAMNAQKISGTTPAWNGAIDFCIDIVRNFGKE